MPIIAPGPYPPRPDDAEIIAALKDDFVSLEAHILKCVPANRERSLALTNLEQASMWATKACNMVPEDPKGDA